MLYVNKEKKYVATYKEILLIFIAFCVVLFVLYPKDFLAKQILNEKDNYDLSMLYLNNMLKNDPDNEALMMTLAKQSLETGKKDLSIKLLELLKHSDNKKVREETYILSYKLLKEDYLYLENRGEIQKLQKVYVKLKDLMNLIVLTRIENIEDIRALYNEASFLHDDKNSLKLVKKLLKITPKEVSLNKAAFYLSTQLSKSDEAMYYLDKLILLDADNEQEWIEAKYYLLLGSSNYKESEDFLINKAKDSIVWRKKLLSFYEYNKEYRSIAQVHMRLFKKTKIKEDQYYHWFKAIYALRNAKYLDEAIELGLEYEDYFINNKKARMELLKLYISSNKLDEASNLSKKILLQRGN